ncbi:MAG: isoleucine--tRNA ligase [Bacteroidetes bacterium]|nr:isoleucine--tRNA ligase [Bacteroidota bacterium]MBU1578326.1 isoleucine--tRNA ligase [Bacteroidota bacterium]MBU2557439.1 isoleucine--tRNA ligase [Bacteroidota bacterium]
MKATYKEYKQLDLTRIGEEIRAFWEKEDIFKKSLDNRSGNEPFVFYEGPPSANGIPGIHHVMARAIKDIFCRYQTLKGKFVDRKAGWDTHGLPVEISVEKSLGITKEDIGKKISVEDYNKACRTEVMKYKDLWDELTRAMGYWVDLEHPYITFDNKYIETVWYLLSKLDEKGLLYKGYTIQPYSPAAGTGLSTHELNQPGCYRDVKDTSATAQFEIIANEKTAFLSADSSIPLFFLAWTTTPWTLPSNTALAVGPEIDYQLIRTFNPYTGLEVQLILAKKLVPNYFEPEMADVALDTYKSGDKKIPYQIVSECKGKSLKGINYKQLIPWIKPMGDAFRVVTGDFVTIEDGTGIVHIAPTFGADDDRVAKQSGIAPLVLLDSDGNRRPMVDLSGRFYTIEALDKSFVKDYVNLSAYKEFAGRYVKNDYDESLSKDDASLDVDIAVMLKKENKAFRIEKFVHSYPHCWRTDKPILYYPLDSWFIKTTAMRERMMALNNTINWKPKSTGEGRFGNWLENLVDWNLSRSRFWGVPLPIWTSEDKSDQRIIGSAAELKMAISEAVKAGLMEKNPLNDFTENDFSASNYNSFDLHRPYVDNIVLLSESGKPMFREPDLIDVWFDSGAMPYAQMHYPFENKESFEKNFPADFIAEGVDQTRGWFFTLHAIASMLFDSVAYKTVVSNGLVLDKKGNKMSKRLGNAVDPFETINTYGPDATRWYMITNAQPWDNLKFDLNGLDEVRRKFFGTLHNTYAFFALYANIDRFSYTEKDIPSAERPEIDRWILSELNSLILSVDESYKTYEPTRAGRAIQQFVDEHLSNWYVRLSRRRFWKGQYSHDKISAYQTLYTCLDIIARLMSPIAPFFSERLYLDLHAASAKYDKESIHLTDFPEADTGLIDKALEERMQMAQQISSMVLSLRKKSNLRVRQPLNKIMIPVSSDEMAQQLEKVADLILSEVNIKEIEYLKEDTSRLVKKIKPNFKRLGPRYGKLMKQLSAAFAGMTQEDIHDFEIQNSFVLNLEGQQIELELEDAEITTEDIPGWIVSTQNQLTVALDITVTEELANEGLAREIVNRVQNMRKDKGFEVTDKITLRIELNNQIEQAVKQFESYICSETLAIIDTKTPILTTAENEFDLTDNVRVKMEVDKD